MGMILAARCLVCDIVLSGPLSGLFWVFGISRRARNPNLCSRCDTHLQEGRVVELTVFFADLTSFTELTNELGPERAYEVIDAFFQMTNCVLVKHDAFIDKYIGDAVMAIFNAPIQSDDHARKAVAATLDVQQGLGALREQFNLDLKARIGIASGYARVGRIGSADRKDYTAIGDVVNLASRLEGQASPGEIVVDQRAYEQIAPEIPDIPAEMLVVKGFKDPVPAHRISTTEVQRRVIPVVDKVDTLKARQAMGLGAILFAILGAPCAASAILSQLSVALGLGALMGVLLPALMTLDSAPIRLTLQGIALLGALANLYVIWYGHQRFQQAGHNGDGTLTLTRVERRRVRLVASLAITTLLIMVFEVYTHVFMMGGSLL